MQTSPGAYCTFRQRSLLLDREKAECYNETVTGNEKESTARLKAQRAPALVERGLEARPENGLGAAYRPAPPADALRIRWVRPLQRLDIEPSAFWRRSVPAEVRIREVRIK